LGRDGRNSAADGEKKSIQTVVGKPEGKRRPGRPTTRWKNTLKTELQRSRGRVLVEKLKVPQLVKKKKIPAFL